MKYSVIIPLFFLLLIGCKDSGMQPSITVTNKDGLSAALANAKPGDEIVLANGVWEDVQIRMTASGTEDKPITLRAETPGEVLIQGASDLKLGGDYLIVDGLYFVNGHSPSNAVIEYAVSTDSVANHSIVKNCVIKDFNKAQRNLTDLWVLFKGRHNQLDHSYLAGKSNRGPTVRVDLAGNRNINNYHKITNNHFGPRPPKGGPSAESIQLGNSFTSMCPSYTLVANNLFDECNGEVEIISSKTNFNEFRNNVFYKSEGSLVTRHGNYCTIDGNYFIGDGESANYGGIRIIGTGHTATNNYFYNLRGQNFRSPLAVMNGIPKSPLNRYIQVTDVVVANNSWIDCTSPLQFGVGTNVSQKDVLPASEIRSARPIRTIVANNLIYNTKGDKAPIVAHDLIDGITFKSNIINNQGVVFEPSDALESKTFTLKELSENIWVPTTDFPEVPVYDGFGFEAFQQDLFGASRKDNNMVGAIVGAPTVAPSPLDRTDYGPTWYTAEPSKAAPNTLEVYTTTDLATVIADAQDGDIIAFEAGSYEIGSSLKIDKTLTLKGKSDGDVTLVYKGGKNTPLFEMNPKANLTLKGMNLRGDMGQYAFASLEENMSSKYDLYVGNCNIEAFDYVLKAFKYSFAENITFDNTTVKDCQNGLELSEETEDKGEYNAENISITNCHFEGVQENVLDYYRGGYDESTVGGTLVVANSTFTKCGAKEKNGILLNTYGIVNVDISGNTFKDNKVKLVAQLWGAKNNTHSNNTINNSGKIVVEENLKLNLLY
ncbi:chondroitinase-B domain-containing protein [Maribacter polysaccharolyticus]|uniref:chondroitinase-B domain-containing protein n=1 Tax=Maribacter polysaccharolyticus TaxID=3020831 RepID=UPI00237F6BDA|nr:chondroitinase-B domain-containing protein [Maribacter polysaccharolyticus]MDE3741268.1 chondroitinase-B domain-containing protein [Maribacter polysaccharolyticus]